MKNLTLLGLGLLLANFAFAGHNETNRRSCSFFWKRHKAEAHAGQCALYHRDAHGGCGSSYDANANYDESCAFANSHASSSGSWGSWTVNCKNSCYYAGFLSPLSQAMDLDYSSADDGTSDPDWQGISNNVSYNFDFVNDDMGNKYITLSNININLQFDASITDRSNTIAMTFYDLDPNNYHDEDNAEIIYGNEILFQTSIALTGDKFSFINSNKNLSSGQAFLETGQDVAGVFSMSDFSFTVDAAGYSHLVYIGPTVKTVMLNAYYSDDDSWNNSNLSINAAGDCKPNEAKRFGQIAASTATVANANVSVFPSPATSDIRIECPNIPNAKVSIFNLEGQVLGLPVAKIGDNTFKADLRQIPAGSYYILITNEKERVLKQFTKQ